MICLAFSKLIQKFVFLIRDWNNRKVYKFGYYDKSCKPIGQEKNLTDKIFRETENQSWSIKETRKIIKDLSGDVSIFAMPHPGENPEPSVDPTEWSAEFRNQVVAFVCKICSPDFISKSIKQVCGTTVTGNELLKFVRIWAKTLEDPDKLPNIQSIMATTIQLQGSKLLSKCESCYTNAMDNVVKKYPDGLSLNLFDARHSVYLYEALQMFNNTNLLGGEKVHRVYEQKLRDAIEAIRREKLTTNANNLRISAEREKAMALAEQQRQQREAAEMARAEAQKRGSEERRLKIEAEKKAYQERIQREAAESGARRRKAALVEVAMEGVNSSQKHLEWTQNNLAQVKSNTAAFEYYVTEFEKKRTQIMGIIASPRYVPYQVKKINHEGYNGAVQRAEYDVQQAEERLAAANLALQLAQSYILVGKL